MRTARAECKEGGDVPAVEGEDAQELVGHGVLRGGGRDGMQRNVVGAAAARGGRVDMMAFRWATLRLGHVSPVVLVAPNVVRGATTAACKHRCEVRSVTGSASAH